MLWLAVGIGVALVLLERLIPDRKLPMVRGWWLRVVILNGIQLGIVFVGGLVWSRWLQGWSVLSLDFLPAVVSGLISYIVITFIFYWWHRLRHRWNFLWRVFHQVHHSPQRIEILTAFYKHPVEMVVNSMLVSVINYTLFGLTIDAAAWVLLFTACGEYFYHMNIRTPHFVGYFIQRPEMHCIHHKRKVHDYNYGDLPIWDMLFGTYINPKQFRGKCGFALDNERKIMPMLRFKEIE